MNQIDVVTTLTKQVLTNHTNGHGFDHVERVRQLALRLAECEGGDRQVIELAALLHDVDDYKLFGQQAAADLMNAKRILQQAKIDKLTSQAVLEIVRSMGYSNYLKGIRPQTIEGWIVSDADMCDAIGTQGILRTHAYTLSQDRLFFDPAIAPRTGELSPDQYQVGAPHGVQHFFDKLLLIPDLILTESGRQIAKQRQQIMIDFLANLFEETEAAVWQKYLQDFIKQA